MTPLSEAEPPPNAVNVVVIAAACAVGWQNAITTLGCFFVSPPSEKSCLFRGGSGSDQSQNNPTHVCQGWPFTRAGPTRPPDAGVDPTEVVRLRDSGMSWRAIGRKLDTSPRTARRAYARGPDYHPGPFESKLPRTKNRQTIFWRTSRSLILSRTLRITVSDQSLPGSADGTKPACWHLNATGLFPLRYPPNEPVHFL